MDAASAEKEGQVYEALLDGASTERELRACIVLVFFFLCRSIILSCRSKWGRIMKRRMGLRDASLLVFFCIWEYYFEQPKHKSTYGYVEFVYEHKEEAKHVLNRGAEAITRGA
jgi:hypothetical protein